MPRTSIILPCYNVEQYLPRAIESVLAQTYTDFELLVVIDGSPDNSKEIAESYAINDKRIQVFEKVNGGLSDARNFGLERAQGEFVYFMDSDDWIAPNLLEDNLKIIKEENLDLVIFGYIQDDEDKQGNLINSKYVLPKLEKLVKADKNIILDTHHIGLMGYVWNKMYRKSFLDQYNFRFEKGTSLVEDILFNAPVYTKLNHIRFNTNAYYNHINRPIVTLMKTFHVNSFELKKQKNQALSLFFKEWNIPNQKELLSYILIQGIRNCIHSLFSYKNQLTSKQKMKYIKEMYQDEVTISSIKNYKATGMNSKIYKTLIKNKNVLATYAFARIKK